MKDLYELLCKKLISQNNKDIILELQKIFRYICQNNPRIKFFLWELVKQSLYITEADVENENEKYKYLFQEFLNIILEKRSTICAKYKENLNFPLLITILKNFLLDKIRSINSRKRKSKEVPIEKIFYSNNNSEKENLDFLYYQEYDFYVSLKIESVIKWIIKLYKEGKITLNDLEALCFKVYKDIYNKKIKINKKENTIDKTLERFRKKLRKYDENYLEIIQDILMDTYFRYDLIEIIKKEICENILNIK